MVSPDHAWLEEIDRLIDRVEQLHSSPHVAGRVLELLQDDQFRIEELVRCLEADPALATAILKLVNSCYFGLTYEVSSLQQAVVYLGCRSLRLLVISFGLLESLTRGAPARVYHDFWRRALTMAAAASGLCLARPGVSQHEAQTAGLLADIGTLVLVQAETERYVPLYEEHGHTPALVEAERAEFGFDHGIVGARLLDRWNLPEPLASAAAQHHDPGEQGELVEVVVRAASLLADALWTPATPYLPAAQSLLESRFQLDLDGFMMLAADCQQKISEYVEVFGVQVSGRIDCLALLEHARQRYQCEALQAAVDLDSLAMLEQRWSP